jgi:hypothetical protein
MDGSGKSATIGAVFPVLSAATNKMAEWGHLRPTLLPPLSCLLGMSNVQKGPTFNPHGSKPSGTLGSIFRLVYIWIDFVVGYWIKLRPKLGKSPTVLIFDRYAFDLVMDPQRFRIQLPSWLLRLAVRTVPQPDVSICLNAPVDIIIARKQELPCEELERQSVLLNDYAADNPRAVLISTDATIEEVRDRVLVSLCDRLKDRIGWYDVNV